MVAEAVNVLFIRIVVQCMMEQTTFDDNWKGVEETRDDDDDDAAAVAAAPPIWWWKKKKKKGMSTDALLFTLQ